MIKAAGLYVCWRPNSDWPPVQCIQCWPLPNCNRIGFGHSPSAPSHRTQSLLPLRANKPRAWTNEYVRHGTQALLAALEIATGKVVAHVRDRRTNLNIHKNEAAK
jgi:hypothetical protein